MLNSTLTLGICTNRADRLVNCCRIIMNLLNCIDQCVIVIDMPQSQKTYDIINKLPENIKIITNDRNIGLSHCRNKIIYNCITSHVLFIDDDVLLTPESVQSVRQAFGAGYEIVGVRIAGPPQLRLPWYVTTGQLHYLGVHAGPGPHRTWGACMGFNVSFVRTHSLSFRDTLGRRNGQLASGEDTTFVEEMKRFGAREAFLDRVTVIHDFDPTRLNAAYLARRAYWQGRSEVRRRAVGRGFLKEWKRFTKYKGEIFKKYTTAFAYSTAFISGVVHELLLGRQRPVAIRNASLLKQSRPSDTPKLLGERAADPDQTVPNRKLTNESVISESIVQNPEILPPP